MTAGNPVSFRELDARLEENDRVLLAAAVLADETDGEVFSLEQGRPVCGPSRTTQRDSERTALKAQVRAAERDGNMAEALRLSAELSRMEQG